MIVGGKSTLFLCLFKKKSFQSTSEFSCLFSYWCPLFWGAFDVPVTTYWPDIHSPAVWSCLEAQTGQVFLVGCWAKISPVTIAPVHPAKDCTYCLWQLCLGSKACNTSHSRWRVFLPHQFWSALASETGTHLTSPCGSGRDFTNLGGFYNPPPP